MLQPLAFRSSGADMADTKAAADPKIDVQALSFYYGAKRALQDIFTE